MPKIYIPNQGFHDLSDAEIFGTLTPLTKGKQNLLNLGRIMREFEDALKGSTANDYILICGPSVMSSLLCTIFARKHNCLNLLLFHQKRDGRYIYRERNVLFD